MYNIQLYAYICISFFLTVLYNRTKLRLSLIARYKGTFFFVLEFIQVGALNYNLGKGIVDKLTKLSKLGFSVECFTADF